MLFPLAGAIQGNQASLGKLVRLIVGLVFYPREIANQGYLALSDN